MRKGEKLGDNVTLYTVCQSFHDGTLFAFVASFDFHDAYERLCASVESNPNLEFFWFEQKVDNLTHYRPEEKT